MIKKIHKFLLNKKIPFYKDKWSYLKLWFYIAICHTYDYIYINHNTKGIQTVLLLKKNKNILTVITAALDFNIINREDTAHWINLCLSNFKFKGYDEIRFPVRGYQEDLINFITRSFGEELSFTSNKFENISNKLFFNDDTIIIYTRIL